ncbi:unnamed protein product [Linum tenue]|uniref:Uncharacterized protein n=1 Tax=Linum tenue TaxID=586396 RepID=A0AAV0K194_9ROSI|nr:unnamed protein product [Linum tenue]
MERKKAEKVNQLKMGFPKEEKSKRVLRGVKTVFFIIVMIFSFLIFSAPVLLVIADTLLPVSLLSASLSPSSFSLSTLSADLSNYDFRYSLVDIPLISILRSAVIFCVYSFCDGPRLSRGPYLGITAICSVSSLIYVSVKAPFIHPSPVHRQLSHCLRYAHNDKWGRPPEGPTILLEKSWCYLISACQKGLPRYQKKILQEERVDPKDASDLEMIEEEEDETRLTKLTEMVDMVQ